jgi:hypothetical protein
MRIYIARPAAVDGSPGELYEAERMDENTLL